MPMRIAAMPMITEVGSWISTITGQLHPQVRGRQRQPVRELLVRDARTVPALDLLVIRDVVAQLLQPRRHLACMARVHPVVSRREIEEDRRVTQPARRVLV